MNLDRAVVTNNLGGLAQGTAADPVIHLENFVRLADGTVGDMVVSNLTEYSANNFHLNGLDGDFNNINIVAGSVDLLFSFLDPVTKLPLVMPEFNMTVYDLDGPASDYYAERFSVHSEDFVYYNLTATSDVLVTTTGNVTNFGGSSWGLGCDNPSSIATVGMVHCKTGLLDQKDRSVALLMKGGKSSYRITLWASSVATIGRNFLFGLPAYFDHLCLAPTPSPTPAPPTPAPPSPDAATSFGDPHVSNLKEMEKDSDLGCFVYEIKLEGTTTSFRILEEGNDDSAIYPDIPEAHPHTSHKILGPNGSYMDQAWVIGAHPMDKAAAGERYRVQFYLDQDSRPWKVTWMHLENAEDVSQPPPSTTRSRRMRPSMQLAKFDLDAEAARSQQEATCAAGQGQDLSYQPMSKDATLWEIQQLRYEELQVAEAERVAQQRYSVYGPSSEVAALEDADVSSSHDRLISKAEAEQEERILRNKKRYLQDLSRSARGMQPHILEGDYVLNISRGMCVECKTETKMQINGSWCCDSCLEAYDAICKEGWNGAVDLDGIYAANRAKGVAEQRGISTIAARRVVMEQFPKKFRQRSR